MDERRAVRASDKERQAAADRLRSALDEGRLSLHEYDDRLASAYRAVTYGDLAELFVDLPESGWAAKPVVTQPVPTRLSVPVARPVPVATGMPTALRVLWTIWLGIVSVNLGVWAMVCLTSGNLIYFWPMWVAGPAGAGLLGVTIGVGAIRKGRTAQRRGIQR